MKSKPAPAANPRVRDVLVALRGAFESRGWHGPTVLQSLRGVAPSQADERPAGIHHSIHEQIRHVEYWEGAGIRYVIRAQGARLAPRRPSGRRDWTPSTGGFAESVASLKATHQLLLEAVAQLEDAQLDRPVKTQASGVMLLHEVLHGIVAHDAYHAGQIRLIRTLLRER